MMKRAPLIATGLAGFLLVHLAVAGVRADWVISQAREWRWRDEPTLQLAPEPANEMPDQEFNPLDHLFPIEEGIASRFAIARSIAEMNEIRRQAYREEVQLRQLGSGGPLPVWLASMIAALADPVALLIAVAVGAGTLAAWNGPLRWFVAGVAGGAAGNGAAEIFASWHQYVRPAGLMVAVLLVCGALFLAAIGANWLARQFVRHGRR